MAFWELELEVHIRGRNNNTPQALGFMTQWLAITTVSQQFQAPGFPRREKRRIFKEE